MHWRDWHLFGSAGLAGLAIICKPSNVIMFIGLSACLTRHFCAVPAARHSHLLKTTYGVLLMPHTTQSSTSACLIQELCRTLYAWLCDHAYIHCQQTAAMLQETESWQPAPSLPPSATLHETC